MDRMCEKGLEKEKVRESTLQLLTKTDGNFKFSICGMETMGENILVIICLNRRSSTVCHAELYTWPELRDIMS